MVGGRTRPSRSSAACSRRDLPLRVPIAQRRHVLIALCTDVGDFSLHCAEPRRPDTGREDCSMCVEARLAVARADAAAALAVRHAALLILSAVKAAIEAARVAAAECIGEAELIAAIFIPADSCSTNSSAATEPPRGHQRQRRQRGGGRGRCAATAGRRCG